MSERDTLRLAARRAALHASIRDGDAETAETRMREHMVEYVNYARRRYPALLDEVVEWR